MLRVTNLSYAATHGHRPMIMCIVTLYLFIILLRCAGRCISAVVISLPHTLITVSAVSGFIATVEIPSEDDDPML